MKASPAQSGVYLRGSELLPPDEPRLSVLWRAKIRIFLCAGFAAVVAATIGVLPQTEYTAQATIRVSLLSAKGVPREVVLAQNDLAAQYALLATTTPILDAAEALAGEPVGEVEASPVNSYNIVGITATSPTSEGAARHANAVAEALVTYVRTSDARAAAAAAKVIEPQLQQLDKQIADTKANVANLQRRIPTATVARAESLRGILASQLSLLGTLVANRANVFTSATRDSAAATPQLSLLDQPVHGTAEPNRAPIYALVAFLVTALAAAEITVLLYRLRVLNQAGAARHASTGRFKLPVVLAADEEETTDDLVLQGAPRS